LVAPPGGCGKKLPLSVADWNVTNCSYSTSSADFEVEALYDKTFSFSGGTDASGHRDLEWEYELKGSYAGWTKTCATCEGGDSYELEIRAKLTFDPTAVDCDKKEFGWFLVAGATVSSNSNCTSTTVGLNGDTKCGTINLCCQCDDNNHTTDINAKVEVKHIVKITAAGGSLDLIRSESSSRCEMTKDAFSCKPAAGACP